MNLNLEGKLAIVGGGMGTIGGAIVKALKDEGADVVIADLQGPSIIDLANEDDIQGLCDIAPDIFINVSYPPNSIYHIFTFYYPALKIAASMQRRCGGVIVIFASIYGVIVPRRHIYYNTTVNEPGTSYCFSKAAIIHMTKVLAAKYANGDVRINCISPGGVEEDQDDKFKLAYKYLTPMRRMATVEDIIGPVLFLCSDMSKYITGINLLVDGGITL